MDAETIAGAMTVQKALNKYESLANAADGLVLVTKTIASVAPRNIIPTPNPMIYD